MNFDLPEKLRKNAQTFNEVPSKLSQYKIPFSKAKYVTFTGGSYLTQELKGEDFSIWVHHFFIKEKVCLHPIICKQAIMLHYTHKGEVLCELISFGKIFLQEGTYHLFCVPKGIKHNAYFEPGHFCSLHIDITEEQLMSLNLSEQGKNSLMRYLKNPEAVGLKLYEGQSRPVVRLAIKKVQQCKLDDETLFKEFLKVSLHQLIYYFAEDLASQRYELGNNSGKMDDIALYIENHLENNITLKDIAHKFHITVSSLKRNWKFYKGSTIGNYILKRRMETAKILLLETDLNLIEVSIAVGYNSHASFSRVFKEYTGVYPSKYRKTKHKF
jgi:AraC-like DNA-binding protein